jgi:cytochrome c-type biogenesis protein
MSPLDTYIGGVHAFFSIWVFCLMQVIPFFVAYLVGSALLESADGASISRWRVFAVNFSLAAGGFIAVFTAMGMVSTSTSKIIFRNLALANQFGGVAMGLLALYVAGVLTLDEKSSAAKIGAKAGAFILGGGLALAYKPCVTPTLTYIYGVTQTEETSARGGLLLAFYTLGEFTAIGALAVALMWLSLKSGGLALRKGVRMVCATALIAVSVMILTDKMTIYKSFLVGRFVTQPGHDHSAGPGPAEGHDHSAGHEHGH